MKLAKQAKPSAVNASKNSGRNSRRDSGQAFELSSKREFMDLCQSPTGLAMLQPQADDSTFDRAADQEEILATNDLRESLKKRAFGQDMGFDLNLEASKESKTMREADDKALDHAKVSEFNQGQVIQKTERGQKTFNKEKLTLKKVDHRPAGDRDDSLKRVGFFLEKIKERNSSLQERLNLSFKKSSRLDQSSISYRPTTSFANKKNLKGVLIDRDCISLTRNLDGSLLKQESNNDNSLDEAKLAKKQPMVSKTPNIVNLQSQNGPNQEMTENDSF